MNKPLFISVFILLICSMSACVSEQKKDLLLLPKDAYTRHLKVGEMQITVKKMPVANLSKDNMQTNGQGSAEEYTYFDIRIEKSSEQKLSKEQTLYSLFEIQNDFTLTAKGDSLRSVFCQRIENGLPGSYEYMVAFEKPLQTNNHSTLIYQDKIFGLGTVAFEY